MIRARRSIAARRRMAGLSLIEMMVALVMALIVAAGIISVFTSTSSSNKVQAQMATLQEEGRFAIYSLRSDLANANSGYCSNTGGNAGVTASGLYLDALRSPTVYAQNVTFPDDPITLPTPTQAYSLPSSLFMRGYQCTATTCTPAGLAGLAGIPKMGRAAGSRVVGADVLTIRYLKPGSGWAIAPGGSSINVAGGSVNTITLKQLPGEDPINDFTGSLAMLADCSNAQVFAVSNAGGTLTPQNNFPGYQPQNITNGSAPRVFDFTNDFQTVTYYLQVVNAGNGRTTGELMRRVNGGAPQQLVRGVERLDFRYGIIDAKGNTEFLTADRVNDRNKGAISCPPGNPTNLVLDPDPVSPLQEQGCLWRAVQTIEVHILMDGQTPLYTLTPAEMNYTYTPDGDTSPQPPTEAKRVIQLSAQGFPTQLLRREFTTLVSLRNFNP